MLTKILASLGDAALERKKQPTVILWGVSISPYVRKIMVALAEKNIAYEQREILPKILLEATGQSVPEDFNRMSPLGKIPALQVDDFSVADSAAITGYLDRKFSTGHLLYPSNPEEYARALWFEHYSDHVLTGVAYQNIFLECVVKPKVLNQEPHVNTVDTAKENELPPLLDYLNDSVVKYPWLSGSQFSMADVAIATQLLALKMAGFVINTKRWSNLNRYLEKVVSRKSFEKIVA